MNLPSSIFSNSSLNRPGIPNMVPVDTKMSINISPDTCWGSFFPASPHWLNPLSDLSDTDLSKAIKILQWQDLLKSSRLADQYISKFLSILKNRFYLPQLQMLMIHSSAELAVQLEESANQYLKLTNNKCIMRFKQTRKSTIYALVNHQPFLRLKNLVGLNVAAKKYWKKNLGCFFFTTLTFS